MKPSLLREITLYRYRYYIVYGLVILLLGLVLLTDIGNVPSGIKDTEAASVVASNSLNPFSPKAADVVSLPYHMLQKLSVGLFGLSPLTIRLPSIALGFIACGLLAITLNLWFRKNIATIALALAITSVPFIAMARSGVADALYMVLLLLVLLGAAKLTMQKHSSFAWKLLVTMAGLLLLYMPLGIYAVVTLFIAGIFHPHVRYQLKRTKWWQYLILALVACVLLAPIALASFQDTSTLKYLFGATQLRAKLNPDTLLASGGAVLETLFAFHKPHIANVFIPFVSLPMALLVLFGLVRTIADHHAARSYMLHMWLLVSLVLLFLNPTSFPLLFVPSMFLVAIGLETFMREWYQVFPRNPYARIGALMPLTLIVIGIVAASITRYFYGFYYSDTRNVYKPELAAVRQTLKPHVNTRLVVPADQHAFYDILRSKYPQLTVSGPSGANTSGASELIVLASTNQTVRRVPSKIVTSGHKEDGVLLRVYDQTR